MDKIIIKDLEVYGKHGVLQEENVLGQKFLVSAEILISTRKAGITDAIELSVNYAEVCKFINEFMRKHVFNLIEAAAENLALGLFTKFSEIRDVKITIKKPWAPIGLPLETVSVKIERKWHTAYIALGSNLGDKEGYLNQAMESLDNEEGCEVVKCSDFIVTEPYGMTEQEEFLNGCLELRTLLSPVELLKLLNRLEKEAHRERIIHWGPRTLDLDIIFYDDIIWDSEKLIIPHKDMKNRDFVLKPLAQIAPYKRHPVYRKTVEEMLEELNK